MLTQEADLQGTMTRSNRRRREKRTLEFDPQGHLHSNSRIRPAEAPAFDAQRHPESTVAQSQRLITVAQSISGVENAQGMTEPARECLLSRYRTLQVKSPPLPNLLLI